MSFIRSLSEGVRFVIQEAARLLGRPGGKSGAAEESNPNRGRTMLTPSGSASGRIRPLKDHLILYVDESNESREAEELLQSVGISPFVTDGAVGPFDTKPLVIYHGGFYRGLSEIRGLVNLLHFWSNQPLEQNRTVFRTSD